MITKSENKFYFEIPQETKIIPRLEKIKDKVK
jgi:hypothetical protein